MDQLLVFAVTTYEEIELFSGPLLLATHMIAIALENPLDFYVMSLSDVKSLWTWSNCHLCSNS